MKRIGWISGLVALALACLAAGSPATAQVIGGVKSIQVANNTTSIAVCPGSCTLTGLVVYNNSATIAYVKLYATVQASVACGTPTPSDRHLIPASTSGAGAVIPLPTPVYYPSGLTACITTGIADNDTTAPAASAYIVNAYTK